jgi:hypothetical protein
MALTLISPREASIFACLIDAVVDPAPPLPPVWETDAVLFLDRWLARSPQPQRSGLRVLLYLTEVGPLLVGFRRRMRRLAPEQRLRYVRRLERAPLAPVRQISKLVNGMATLAYYGDDAVMALLGYDADTNVARGRALRAAEGRP